MCVPRGTAVVSFAHDSKAEMHQACEDHSLSSAPTEISLPALSIPECWSCGVEFCRLNVFLGMQTSLRELSACETSHYSLTPCSLSHAPAYRKEIMPLMHLQPGVSNARQQEANWRQAGSSVMEILVAACSFSLMGYCIRCSQPRARSYGAAHFKTGLSRKCVLIC